MVRIIFIAFNRKKGNLNWIDVMTSFAGPKTYVEN